MRLSECSIPWFYSTLENNSDNNNNKQPFTGLFLKQAGSRLGRGKGSSPTRLPLPKSRDAADSTISCLICPWTRSAAPVHHLETQSVSGRLFGSQFGTLRFYFLLCHTSPMCSWPSHSASVLMWNMRKALIAHSKYSKVLVKEVVCLGGRRWKSRYVKLLRCVHWFWLLPLEKAAGIILYGSTVVVAITTLHFNDTRPMVMVR